MTPQASTAADLTGLFSGVNTCKLTQTGRDTFNDGDSIYDDSMLMKITEESGGYLGVLVLAADSDKDGA